MGDDAVFTIVRCSKCGDLFRVENAQEDEEYICDGCFQEMVIEQEEAHRAETQS